MGIVRFKRYCLQKSGDEYMNYCQNFIEMLFRIRKPYSEEQFVIEALENVNDKSSFNLTNNEQKEYADVAFSFIFIVKDELKKLYLMNALHCNYLSISDQELTELYAEVDEFTKMEKKFSNIVEENLVLYNNLKQSDIGESNIISIRQTEIRLFEVFGAYLLLCKKTISEAIGKSQLEQSQHNKDPYLSFPGTVSSVRETMHKKPSIGPCACAIPNCMCPTNCNTDEGKFDEIRHAIKGIYKKSFQSMLFSIIDEKGLSDPEVYNKARVSRQVFSNIRRDPQYVPKKVTVISLCIALELPIEKATLILSSCGYCLSEYIMYDRIINYYIGQLCYDFDEINTTLIHFHLKPIGCSLE